MVIFHSYVSLPEGNLEVSNMGVPAVIIHSQMDCPSDFFLPSSDKGVSIPMEIPISPLTVQFINNGHTLW